MEFVVLIALGLVPGLALLFAPRDTLKPVAGITALVFLLGLIWTVSFGNSCQSDGCIGVFLIGAATALTGIGSMLAGLIRWALIARADRRNNSED